MFLRYGPKQALVALISLLIAGCTTNAPATIPGGVSQYARIGILPAYEAEISRRTPPGLIDNALVERMDIDLAVNEFVTNYAAELLTQNHQVVDLRSLSAEYMATPKVISNGQRKIFGDSRPLAAEVVRDLAGAQGLDAYVIIDGGPVWLSEQQVAPIVQMLAKQENYLAVMLNVYVVDGRTFEIVAASRNQPSRRIPEAWFTAPRQHVDEIDGAVKELLKPYLKTAFQNLGLN